MIPKLIHMCWFGRNPYPKKIQYCLDTWKKVLPDYEVVLWNEDRFDVNSIPWTKQAYESRRFAFVADYVRFHAINQYGGLYLDTDVEVIRSFDDLLHLPYFIGKESISEILELSAFGAEKGTVWVKDALEYYTNRNFQKDEGEQDDLALPLAMWPILKQKYEVTLIESVSQFDPDPSKICAFPTEWFNAHPIDSESKRHYTVTENTRCVHHFANSWTLENYTGGILHKLYYKITGKDWKLNDKRFRLYGTDKIK